MTKILIAEDEEAIAELIRLSLLTEGYHCTWAPDGTTAADLIEREHFDLALLDVMLPGIDGRELLDYCRLCGIPAIFLTALGDLDSRVRGLRAGAEDYIAKPFEVPELQARVAAVLRRCRAEQPDAVISFGDIALDPAARTVTRAGLPVRLTAKEFDLLLYLARNPNRALYRSQIFAQVWGSDFLGDSRTIDLHIQRLRHKLGPALRLVPVYKVGYRLEVQP